MVRDLNAVGEPVLEIHLVGVKDPILLRGISFEEYEAAIVADELNEMAGPDALCPEHGPRCGFDSEGRIKAESGYPGYPRGEDPRGGPEGRTRDDDARRRLRRHVYDGSLRTGSGRRAGRGPPPGGLGGRPRVDLLGLPGVSREAPTLALSSRSR